MIEDNAFFLRRVNYLFFGRN